MEGLELSSLFSSQQPVLKPTANLNTSCFEWPHIHSDPEILPIQAEDSCVLQKGSCLQQKGLCVPSNDKVSSAIESGVYDKRLKVISNLEVVKTGEDSCRKTNLDELLSKNKVNELYIVGLDAAGCVNTTVQAAQNRDYNVHIIKETVISKSERKTDSMIVKFMELGVEVISLDSLNIML